MKSTCISTKGLVVAVRAGFFQNAFCIIIHSSRGTGNCRTFKRGLTPFTSLERCLKRSAIAPRRLAILRPVARHQSCQNQFHLISYGDIKQKCCIRHTGHTVFFYRHITHVQWPLREKEDSRGRMSMAHIV